MKLLFAAPSADDLIELLRAWRFWLLGALAGALLGAAAYVVAPPEYRAQATVNVDFHLEQAWPQNSDREQFYYLERETRKLEEIAMSDAVLKPVALQAGAVTVADLRADKLQLSQPGNGGWHFLADDRDPRAAEKTASTWAVEFAKAVQTEVAQPSSGLEQFITAQPVQAEDLTAHRAVSLSVYMLAGAFLLLAVGALAFLLVHRRA